MFKYHGTLIVNNSDKRYAPQNFCQDYQATKNLFQISYYEFPTSLFSNLISRKTLTVVTTKAENPILNFKIKNYQRIGTLFQGISPLFPYSTKYL